MTKDQLKIFLAELEKQNSWGKNQVKELALQVAAGLKD